MNNLLSKTGLYFFVLIFSSFLNIKGFGQGVFGGKVAVMDGASSTIWWNTNAQTCDGPGTGNLSTANATTYNAYLGDRFYMGGNVLTFGFPASGDGAFLEWRYYLVGSSAPAWNPALILPYANNTVCSGGGNKKYEYVPVFGSNIVQCTNVGNYRLDVNLVGFQNSINYPVFVSGNYIPFSVSALDNPASPSTSCSSNPGEVNLSWTKWNSKDVVIIRNTTGVFTGCEPVQGTTYNAGNLIGSGANQATVVYRGSASSFLNTGLNGGTTYHYKIYSENWSYYSSGTAVLTASTYGLWNGSVSTDWHTAGNWSCNTIPTSSIDVVIPSGAPRYPVINASDAVAKSITLNAGSLTMSSARKITVSGNFTRTGGTFDAGDGTVAFNSAATVSGTVTFFNVELSAGVNFGTTSTIGNGTSGSLILNNGGFVTSNAPTYADNSTLVYNSGTNPYNRGDEWSAGASGRGVPFHVEVRTNTLLNLEVGASGTRERRCRGNLSIVGSNSAVTMGWNNIDDLYVGGDVNINATGGLLRLGGWINAIAGDIYVGGDWNHLLGDFQANERGVWFIGAANNQTVNCVPSPGREEFGYFIIDKANNGTVFMNCNAAVRGGNDGSPFQILNGNLDLRGRTFFYFNFYDGTPHYVTVGGTAGNLVRQVTSSVGTGIFNFKHNETVSKTDTIFRAFPGAELSFESNVTVLISRGSSGEVGVHFGDGATVVPKAGQNRTMALTTIKGTLQIDDGGFVDTEPPTYTTGSLLRYNIGDVYNRRDEWKSGSGRGYPFNVQTSRANTRLIAGGTSNTGVVLNMAGNLTIDASSTFDMTNSGSNNMTVPLTVGQDINISGTLIASGVNNGNIILGRNWTRFTGGTFTHNNRKVSFTGSDNATLMAPATGEVFHGLEISKSSSTNTVTLNNRATVNSLLELNNGVFITRLGDLSTSTKNPLILIAGATYTGGGLNSFVSGPMQKIGSTDFVFPVGKIKNSEYNYRICGVSNLSASETFTAEFFRENANLVGPITAPGITKISFCEYWGIERNATATANVMLSWSAQSPCNMVNYVTFPATIKVVHNTGAVLVHPSGNWDIAGADSWTGNATAGTVTWNNVNNFSPFTLGTTSFFLNALPAQFVDLKGKLQSGTVDLNWNVEGNDLQAGYEIQHSADGTDFKTIGAQTAVPGLSSAAYKLAHTQPVQGWNYYRVLTTDLQGKQTVSSVVRIWFGSISAKPSVYPNPIQGSQINLNTRGLSKGVYALQLIGMDGKIVMQRTINLSGNGEMLTLEAGKALSTGMYWLTITGSQTEPVRIKIIK